MGARPPQREGFPPPVPVRAGVGLRACHHAAILRERPAVAWFEAHSENYFAEGGRLPGMLERLRADYPLSLHGVGLGLGNADPLDRRHLSKLKRIVDRYAPGLVSEHLAWGAAEGRHANDLLPMPYTEESLRHLVTRVGAVQDALGRQILIENVSSYLQWRCSRLTEWDFLSALAAESGCALLLDVNNVYVSALNHEFDAVRYLDALPVGAIREIHLAGHRVVRRGGREIRIDTHDAPVCAAVWELYRQALERFGPVPTLIEWDSDIPPLSVLQAEAARADAILEDRHALVA